MHGRRLPWAGFLVAHLGLGVLALISPGYPLGDVTIMYVRWFEQLAGGVGIAGIHEDWVYPFGAMAPIVAAGLLGGAGYAQGWLLVVLVTNAAGFALLLGRGEPSRARLVAAWWWLGFLVLLGPIAVGRLDTITVPIVIAGLLLAASRPALAGALLTAGAWIKVWPAALVAATLLLGRRVAVRAAVGALCVSAVVTGVVAVLGGGPRLFGFLGAQTGRGLQVESVLATPWTWLARGDGATVAYDTGILTYQVTGPGTAAAAEASTVLMLALVALALLLAARALSRGGDRGQAFLVAATAVVLALIVGNKVGSPQFATWIAAPLVAGLASGHRRWRAPAAIGLAIALLTQAFYPIGYGAYLGGEVPQLLAATARNALYVGLLGWALAALWRLGPEPGPAPTDVASRAAARGAPGTTDREDQHS